jgi:formylglycine-generating enzyme required for sulfatase activity
VPGGTFNRDNDPNYPATVSDFYLDKYEVTVGRFRSFVNAGLGTQASPPATGAGANPLIAGTGWDSTWNYFLAADTTTLQTNVQCDTTYQTWTNTPGNNENLPINCVDWYEAFAFCAWDGGRLPTEAEWEYAATGGSEERVYPWGSTVLGPNADLAIWGCYYNPSWSCSGVTNIAPVGSVPAGNGKWGQSDLAGNVFEFVFDWYAQYVVPCNDCADTTEAANRVGRGGGFSVTNASFLAAAHRFYYNPAMTRYNTLGMRCARTKS